ncbi:RNA polymerase, sigma-24 subunit, ECF subfamily [Beutenbergia cavernae DSM 12333]|uniref:RNA polymerase, sigma-24 subunit, ECF subfamily n=1 Tax=Beutenbergia cavernae (strain ATCC BAA-8 / DSM 12333 / CCUG 43141 / JCM 11478 / NBRC 16432 / NCIMB 13614 / HKI 0122) TaxID=471853 RepID=C5C2S5_BEUC1|nr:RNA polymerase sigma factor SigJ [Beutenbergia cavernae]ACQ81769.1 RNA polymerase, sigma-24 subunit, ECF subfamily [Beutenbergia cavernae DSM 12333]
MGSPVEHARSGDGADAEGASVRQEDVAVFEASRDRLEAIAYRLLGSAVEAEDAVQETFLRWERADRNQVRVPEAWLTRVLTNLCLTQLTSARARREVYVGEWLPEPVLDGDPMLGPADTAEQRDSVSTAVLMLLERLTPPERAVYVLREAFAYPHAEIAELLGISEAASQQLLHRAKQRVATGRSRVQVDSATAREVVEEFLLAAMSGQTEPLVRLLTDDAMGVGDGGGRVPARGTPFVGAVTVARFLRGLFRPADSKRAFFDGRLDLYASTANGSPAVVAVAGGRLIGVMSLEVTDTGIASVLSQVNPDKLGRFARAWAESDHGDPVLVGW